MQGDGEMGDWGGGSFCKSCKKRLYCFIGEDVTGNDRFLFVAEGRVWIHNAKNIYIGTTSASFLFPSDYLTCSLVSRITWLSTPRTYLLSPATEKEVMGSQILTG